MPQPRLGRNARANALIALAGLTAAFALPAAPTRAYPIAPTPLPTATAAPTQAPAGNVLPFDSTVLLVLDQPISSKDSKAGEVVKAHLKEPLVVGGRTIAAAGAPAGIRIADVSRADIGDVYGFVDVFVEPLQLTDGRSLPLRAPVGRLEPHVSAGHESTVEWEDTIEDQVIPYHFLYHIFRKGKNFVLGAGSVVPAQTAATLTALPNGTLAIATPAPIPGSLQRPASAFPVVPAATPLPPTRSRKTPPPLPTPTPTPSSTP